jgi:type IV pilus assembly protein PilV
MNGLFSSTPRARGFVMMDALVAILIFSVGVIGLLAVQANATLLAGDAKYRTDAALQADRLVAQMWVSDPATLVTNFQGSPSSADAPAYAAWVAQLDCSKSQASTNCLPGVSANLPTVTVTATGLVTITVRWKSPNAPAADLPHQYVTVTQVDRT